MGSITYNGVNTELVGIKVWTAPSYEIPERDIEAYHVPGRSGDLIVDYGSYKNVERTYTISKGDESQDFATLAAAIRGWMGNPATYARLEDTYEPLYYRIALGAKAQMINNVLNHAALAEITFTCKPQRFLKTGDTAITVVNGSTRSGSALNPTKYEAKPLIIVYGSGNGTLTVNNTAAGTNFSIQIKNLNSQYPMTIDCELQDCYTSQGNASPNVTLSAGFPYLPNGQNVFQSTTTQITKVEVVPKWWTV